MRPQGLVFRSSVVAILLAGVAPARVPASRAFALPGSGTVVVRWEPGAPNQELWVKNGRQYVLLRQAGFTVVVSLDTYEGGLSAWVMVLDRGGPPRMQIVPSGITYNLFELGAGGQSEAIPLVYQDPDRLAASVGHVSRWAYVFAGMAGMGTQQSTSTGTVTTDDGRTATVNTTTTTYGDPAAEDRAIDNINRNKGRRAGIASDIRRDALRENTLRPYPDPDWTCAGDVYFGFPKHFNFKRHLKLRKRHQTWSELTVPIGNVLFVFPFGDKAK